MWTIEDVKRLQAESDEGVQDIWDAIMELPVYDRPDEDWQQVVYGEISDRGLRSTRR